MESLIHFYGLTFTLWKYKRKIEDKEQNAEKGQSYLSIKKTVGKKYQDDCGEGGVVQRSLQREKDSGDSGK